MQAGLVLLGVAASGALGWAMRRAEDAGIRRAIQEEAFEIENDLGRELDARILALVRMADRWGLVGGTLEYVWRADAENYRKDYRGFWAIAVVAPDRRLVWRVPEDPAMAHLDMGYDPARSRAMETSRRTGEPAVAAPVELFVGGPGMVAFVPMGTHAEGGWMLGVFQFEDFVVATQPPLHAYRLAVTGPDGPVYRSTNAATSSFCATTPLETVGTALSVEVCATPELIAQRRGVLPLATTLVGCAFTALSVALLRALQEARALAESMRRQADALDHARHDVTELSYSVSHELRTPLRAIDGHAAILAEDAAPAALPSLARIRVNAQRMGKQLDGLIELFRIMRRELVPQHVDVTALARDALSRRAAAEPRTPVDAHIADGLTVYGDPQLVYIVVNELVDNAWKFSARRERVWIEVGRTPGGFYVRDRGVGFDTAFQDKLFRAFERLHAPDEFDGLGLGLAMAYRAVGRHGGSIRAEGWVGEGAIFWVVWEPAAALR
ncbi:MAG: ATP-binding protein [Pseudomonadota bacterium]|nr:ATP-binding protein [Pseudomonadota bacterium]